MSEYCKNCEALLQENEELKRQINKIKDYTKHNMQYVDCDNWFERFIYTFEDWKKSLQNDTDRYKQALEEIEESAKELITHTPEYDNCYYKDYCREEKCPPKKTQKFDICLYQEVDKILDIISKAKGKINEKNNRENLL